MHIIAKLTQIRYKANPRKDRGAFKVKIRVKTRQVQEIWSQQLEHKTKRKTNEKRSITQRLRTDLRRSIEATTVIKPV